MGRYFKYISMIIISLVFASVAYSSDINERKKFDKNKVRIGAVFFLTGPASIEKGYLNLAQLTVREINKKGGLLGKQVELLVFDNESTAIDSIRVAREAVKTDIIACVTGCWSSHVLAMAPVFQKAGIPLIAATATNVDVTKVGDYIFRTCFTDDIQGMAIAEFAVQGLGVKTACMLVKRDSDYSIGLARSFSNHIKELDRKILLELQYGEKDVTFKRQLSELKKINPDAIFVPGHLKDSNLILKEGKELNIRSIFLGGDGWGVNFFGMDPQEFSEGFCSMEQINESLTPLGKKMLVLYREEFGSGAAKPVFPVFDTLCVLEDAVKRAGSFNREKIRDAIFETKKLQCATGYLTFNRDGDPVNKEVVIGKYTAKGIEFVQIIKPDISFSNPIRIGGIFPLTGKSKRMNFASQYGAILAVNEINSTGGINGKKLDLVFFDNKSSAIGTKVAAERAVERGVIAVIGPSWSSEARVAAKIMQKNKIPMITNTATHKDITLHKNYIFRACFTNCAQGRALAQFAINDLNSKEAVILKNVSSDYSIDLAENFKNAYSSLGGTVIGEMIYMPDQKNFKTLLVQVKGLNPDVLFLPGHGYCGAILAEAQEQGIRSKFLGSDGWDTNYFFQVGGQNVKEAYYSSHWSIGNKITEVDCFFNKYSLFFGMEPTGDAAMSYDSVMLIREAIEKGESFSSDDIKKNLAVVKDFKGISGSISFNSEGDPDKPVIINRIINGKPEFYKTIRDIEAGH